MKRLTCITLALVLMTLFITPAAFASEGAPAGSCPPVFELHHFMDHPDDHMHEHIGLSVDLNGDGFICMKMLPSGAHLHVDNNLP